MPNLYLISQGAQFRYTKGTIVIEKDGIELDEIEMINIDNVIIYGNVQFTTQAAKALVANGKSIFLLSKLGKLIGRFIPIRSGDHLTMINQINRKNDNSFVLSFSRSIVKSKIDSYQGITQRYESYHKGSSLDEYQEKMDKIASSVSSADNNAALLGLEGAASAQYFGAFRNMLKPEWTFKERIKHPPGDPVNSLLSFAYTLLYYEMDALIESHGMNSNIGYYHQNEYGRRSLASDMIENFRAPLVDRLVLSVLNRNMLDPEDFDESSGGFYLNKRAKKVFIRQYEKQIQQEFEYRNKKSSLRREMQLQVESLKRFVNSSAEYEPFNFRKY